MLDRLLNLKTAILIYISDTDSTLPSFNANDWSLMESLIHLLKPFEELTKRISASKSIISEIIPAVMILDTFLNQSNPSHFGVGTTKEVMLTRLQKRFEHIIKDENLILATFLDPRFKFLFFKQENKETLKKIILNNISKFNNLNLNIIPEVPNNASSTIENLNTEKSLWDFYKEIATSNINSTEAQCSLNYTNLDDYQNFNKDLVVEFEKYCSMNCISIDDDPCSWWKVHCTSFPLIGNKLLLQKYLSAPASSVYSERSFSEAGLVYEAKRSRLMPENAEQLLFIHHNINKF